MLQPEHWKSRNRERVKTSDSCKIVQPVCSTCSRPQANLLQEQRKKTNRLGHRHKGKRHKVLYIHEAFDAH